jgi:hypothetical protein
MNRGNGTKPLKLLDASRDKILDVPLVRTDLKLVEVRKESWLFGNGVAQYVAP